MHPDNRPLLVGLAAAIGALALVLAGPIGSLWRDALWSLCITTAALSLGWFERQLSRAGRPSRLLRWTAIGLVIVAMAFFAMARVGESASAATTRTGAGLRWSRAPAMEHVLKLS
jgi:hypothetical protein